MNSVIPMSETAYYILLSLLEEKHGYGIMQHVEKITGGRIVLGAGTIYATLQKMEKTELIIMCRVDQKRKVYSISEKGRDVLDAEIKRIKELYDNGMEGLKGGFGKKDC